ncbi:hypothetical protein AMTRI_Chr02g259150 [Amborella trichopoda]
MAIMGGRRSRSMVGRTSTCALVLAILLMLSVVLLILLALGILSLPINSKTTPDAFRNSEFRAVSIHESLNFPTDNQKSDGVDGPKQWVEVLSWAPRAFIYHNFLSKEECEYLISLSKPHMRKSTVVDSGTEHGEGLQVLHYEPGQKYEPHFDYFLDEFNTKNGGQRIATILMYLSDVEKGGETVFPQSKVTNNSVPWWDELSECAKSGISVRPRMGDALLFWSMSPDAKLDPKSLHGGCPVIQGDKWSATKWMHVNEYKI